MAKAATVLVNEAHHVGGDEEGGARCVCLTRSAKGVVKAALEAPASQIHAHAPESALAPVGGDGSSRSRHAL